MNVQLPEGLSDELAAQMLAFAKEYHRERTQKTAEDRALDRRRAADPGVKQRRRERERERYATDPVYRNRYIQKARKRAAERRAAVETQEEEYV